MGEGEFFQATLLTLLGRRASPRTASSRAWRRLDAERKGVGNRDPPNSMWPYEDPHSTTEGKHEG
jgi:hypothetical protein